MPDTPWTFVAMEYYALILNRTFRLTVHDQHLEGKVCGGLVASGAGGLSTHVSEGALSEAETYVDSRRLERKNRADFTLPLSDIESVDYTPEKKWGMGEYPHNGRVFVQTPNGKREFIILGDQSCKGIAERLQDAVQRAV